MWDLPGPGLEPVSPALAGGFLTTAPPGKPNATIFISQESLLSTTPSPNLTYSVQFVFVFPLHIMLPSILAYVLLCLLSVSPSLKCQLYEDRDLCLFCSLKSTWHRVGAQKIFMDCFSMTTISCLNTYTRLPLGPPLPTLVHFQASPRVASPQDAKLITCLLCAAATCMHRLQTHQWLPTALGLKSNPPDTVPPAWPAPGLFAPLPPPSPCSSPAGLPSAPPICPSGSQHRA